MSDEKEIKKEEPKKLKTQEEIKRDKRVRRNCFCCGGFVFLLFIISGILLYKLWGGAKDVPVNIPTSTQTTTPTPTNVNSSTVNSSTNNTDQDQSSREVQDCQQVAAPSASPMDISLTNPGYKEDVDYYNYSVYGYTQNNLYDQVVACGPKVNGESFGGTTNWNMNWQSDYASSANSCALKNVTVGLKIDIYLPKWQEPDGAASSAISYWDEYINRLTNHENQHRDMDISAAQDLYNKLSGVSGVTCDDAYSQANSIASQTFADLNARNTEFDATTNHGAN